MATTATMIATLLSQTAAGIVQNGMPSQLPNSQYAVTRYVDMGRSLASGTRVVQMDNSLLNLPATIAASGSVTSALVPTYDVPHIYCRALSTQNGSLVINRYSDQGGLFLANSSTASMTANTTCTLDLTSPGFSQSAQLVISNSAGSGATLSSAVIMLGLT